MIDYSDVQSKLEGETWDGILKATGMGPNTLNRIRKGEVVSLASIQKLADALGEKLEVTVTPEKKRR